MRRIHRAKTNCRMRVERGRGFTLIEAMVALLVISVGMIGGAALLGQSLRGSNAAIFRSQAINLAGDISERIRVNRRAQLDYEGAAADRNCDPAGGGGVDCTPAEMAAHDLFVWQTQVAAALPGGRGEIDVDTGTNPPTYTVTVTWDEVTSDAPVELELVFQLLHY